MAVMFRAELVDFAPVDGLSPCCFLPSVWRVWLFVHGGLLSNDWCADCGKQIA